MSSRSPYNPDLSTLDRRHFLRLLGAAGAAATLLPPGGQRAHAQAPAAAGAPEMVRLPEKTDLILVTDRPPQLETPMRWFAQDLTPNEAFYVRWHLSEIPRSVDLNTFRLQVGGHVDRPLSLSMDDVRKDFEPVEIVAVNQCSGNSRSLFRPPVPGVQWVNGAMGNARWKGARLKDILAKAGLKAGALEISYNGLDKPLLNNTPDFVKALTVERSLDPNVLVAYEMNGAPLPMLNGFPLRLVVPGWFATYWVKALAEVTVLPQKFTGFWMEKAYRIPAAPRAAEAPDKLDPSTLPIAGMSVRSFFSSHADAADVKLNATTEISGVAFDGGSGIRAVEVSTDGGKTWAPATLDKDLGPFSFRRFRLAWKPTAPGAARLAVRATSNAGETQDDTKIWNRSGYLRNNIEQVIVFVS